MSKITKGPWRVVRSNDGEFSIRGKTEPVVYQFGGVAEEADALLIAAAPELFEALKKAVKRYGKPGGPWNVPGSNGSWIAKAKAAIEKAKYGAVRKKSE